MAGTLGAVCEISKRGEVEMETYQVELKGAEAEQIGCRSRLYSLLSSGFRFPSPEIYEGAKTGKFSAEIQAVITNLPYSGLTAGELGRATGLSCEEFQSNYIGLFEVGNNDGPPRSEERRVGKESRSR